MAESLNETFVIPANKGNEQLFSDDSLIAGDSTRSLLTPLFASDYESISKRSVSSTSTSRSSSQSSSSSSSSSSSCSSEDEASDQSSSTSYASLKKHKRYIASIKPPQRRATPQSYGYGKTKDPASLKTANVDQQMKTLTKSWEEWIIEKAIEDLKIIQLKRELKMKKKIEYKLKKEEKQRKKKQEEDNRKRWLAEKNYEYEKRKKEIAAQKEFEKLKGEQQKEIIRTKSKIAYERWLKEKEEKMKEKVSEEKQKSLEMREKGIERRKASQLAYENWLRSAKAEKKKKESRKRINEASDEYFRKLTGAMPSYVNPETWNGTFEQQNLHSFSNLKEKRPYQSPPLLWKDYYERLGKRR